MRQPIERADSRTGEGEQNEAGNATFMGLTIAVCTAATMLTRFLPFLICSAPRGGKPPEVVRVSGPGAARRHLRNAHRLLPQGRQPHSAGSHGIPEAIAIGVTVALHKWKHQTLVSIAGGTLCYVLLVQMVF